MRRTLLALSLVPALLAATGADGAGGVSRAPSALAQASTPSPPPPASAAREAIDALKAAGSTLSGPQSTQEYTARVQTAKGKVERYLETADPGNARLTEAIRAALHYHGMVTNAIARRMTPAEYAEFGRDPAIEQCARLKEFLANFVKPRAQTGPLSEDEAKNRGIAVIGFGLGAVLACAADEAGKAERLLEAKP